MRSGYCILAPGAKIAVSTNWLDRTLASVSKTKKKQTKGKNPDIPANPSPLGYDIIKRLIDGFFEPWDLAVEGGTKPFQDSVIFKSLRSK